VVKTYRLLVIAQTIPDIHIHFFGATEHNMSSPDNIQPPEFTFKKLVSY